MAIQVQTRRGAAAAVDAFTPAAGEIIFDTTRKRVVVGDGATAGGVEIGAARGAAGSILGLYTLEGDIETIAAGATYTSALQIPARAMVLGVSHYVASVIGITGGGTFKITAGGVTFATGLSTAAGGSNAGIGGPNTFYSAMALTLTPETGSAFTGGTIRLSVQYFMITPPSA